jgi:hypothetical protein
MDGLPENIITINCEMNVCKMAIITNRSSIGEGNCGN